MSASGSSSFLRRILWADAVTSGATGLLLALDAGGLEGILGAPAGLLRYAGLQAIAVAGLAELQYVGLRKAEVREA